MSNRLRRKKFRIVNLYLNSKVGRIEMQLPLVLLAPVMGRGITEAGQHQEGSSRSINLQPEILVGACYNPYIPDCKVLVVCHYSSDQSTADASLWRID